MSAAPFKQAAAHLPLQGLKLHAQGRLGKIQPSGGRGDAAFLRHGGEITQLL